MMTSDQNQDVDSGLSLALDDQEASLAPILGNIDGWIKSNLASQDKTCLKCQNKVKSCITKSQTNQANQIDSVLTKINSWINQNQLMHDWTLAGIAVKAGVIEPGQGVDDVRWDIEPAASLGPEYGGTLVLSCRELITTIEPLLEVLREIRDRMGGVPTSIPGETPANAPADLVAVLNFPDAPPEPQREVVVANG